MASSQHNSTSAWHRGERELQSRVGKRELMERVGERVLRTFLPEQHREFFAQLPFVVFGSVDVDGFPWASLLCGSPGFVRSPTATRLQVGAHPVDGDPLHAALVPGAAVGMLGIEVPTRRRNRVNGRVASVAANGFEFAVEQSFGNCPRYINARSLTPVSESDVPVIGTQASAAAVTTFTAFDEATRNLLACADTFFVASVASERGGIEGVDVSHRGGHPGFFRVEGHTLTIPDYAGNAFFNTLGNFLVNPKAGLLFVDFERGDLIAVTGSVELLWDEHCEVKTFAAAERAWRFTLKSGVRLSGAWPFRSTITEMSPDSPIIEQ